VGVKFLPPPQSSVRSKYALHYLPHDGRLAVFKLLGTNARRSASRKRCYDMGTQTINKASSCRRHQPFVLISVEMILQLVWSA
jgi:hypothetical protein